MNHQLAVVLAFGIAASAHAGSISQTQNFSYDLQDDIPATVTFEAFDTMGGTRQLTGVTLITNYNASATMLVSNYDAVPYASGTWHVEAVQGFLALFSDNEGNFGAEYNIGALFLDLTGDLSAGSGSPFPPDGTPGDVTVTGTVSDHFAWQYQTHPSNFAFFSSSGPINATVLALYDFLLYPPPGGGWGIFTTTDALTYNGSLTLVYEYETVPAPAGLAFLALGALAPRRRRR